MSAANRPDWQVIVDGVDISDRLRPRLVALSLSEKRGGEADQLDVTIDDSDGRAPFPKLGATLTLKLGWKSGPDVRIGLVDKGAFTIDEVEASGPPDQIVVRARAADFTGAMTERREKSWHASTIGTIVGEVARRHKLTARCAPALAGIAVDAKAQSRESDIAFLKRLGREHDAVATIKRGALLFNPIGAGTTAQGKPLAALALARRDGDRHSYRIARREDTPGVSADWHDRKGAKKKTVTVGSAEGARKLSRTYASEAEARRAAKAEASRAKRQPASLDLTLAFGRPDIFPERPTRVTGFKPAIDGTSWLVAEVTHTLSDRGFVTALKLENAG